MYTVCFFKNPGYIKNNKAQFDEDSVVTCDKCFSL